MILTGVIAVVLLLSYLIMLVVSKNDEVKSLEHQLKITKIELDHYREKAKSH